MITVEEAQKLIQKCVPLFPSKKVPIESSVGCVLREQMISEREGPAFDRVCMDGIALNYDEWKKGRTSFAVSDMQKAGAPKKILRDSTQCFEVATGAILPQGTDCVVRYEDINIENNKAHLKEGLELSAGQNVHEKGRDYQKGDILLEEGWRIHGPHVGVMASNGYRDVEVADAPSIAIISTGDELVEIDETPAEHQIHKSNPYALSAELKAFGFEQTRLFHLADDRESMREQLDDILQEYSVLVLSGGVSMGKYDFLPQVFAELGVEKVFHKISLRPGKPFWFGSAKQKQLVFALPGNPVSCLIGVRRFIVPSLYRGLGVSEGKEPVKKRSAVLTEDVHFKKELTYFLPVTISSSEGKTYASPTPMNGSGDDTGLGLSEGFIELDKDRQTFPAGESFPLYVWGAN